VGRQNYKPEFFVNALFVNLAQVGTQWRRSPQVKRPEQHGLRKLRDLKQRKATEVPGFEFNGRNTLEGILGRPAISKTCVRQGKGVRSRNMFHS